jgi:hypothetical protein
MSSAGIFRGCMAEINVERNGVEYKRKNTLYMHRINWKREFLSTIK